MKIKAPSFADLLAETSPQLGGARRTKFLETLDRIIPWQDLKALIGPYYSEGKRGAQPYPLELMIRIHFLQLVYNLSDPMCEETLHDSFACRRFVGLTMDSKCPDEDHDPSRFTCLPPPSPSPVTPTIMCVFPGE